VVLKVIYFGLIRGLGFEFIFENTFMINLLEIILSHIIVISSRKINLYSYIQMIHNSQKNHIHYVFVTTKAEKSESDS